MPTWTDPVNVVAGDPATATQYNAQVLENLRYLDQRTETMFFYFSDTVSGAGGDHAWVSFALAATARIAFATPLDFVQLIAIELLASVNATGTLQYDLASDYFAPAAGESNSNHNEAVANATQAVVTNVFEWIDLSAVFTSLGAGDHCGLAITNDGVGGAGTMRLMGIRLRYRRH